MTEKSDFICSIEKSTNEEVDRILRELDGLKYDANQAVLVLNSLNLPVPERIRELVKIEIVPRAKMEVIEIPVPKEQRIKHGGSERRTKSGRKYGDHTKRIANVKAKKLERAQNAANALRGVLSKGPVQVPKAVTEMKQLGFGSEVTRNGFDLLMTNGEAKSQRVQKYQGGAEWVLVSRPLTLEKVRDEVTKKEGDIPLQELKDILGISDGYVLQGYLDDLVRYGILSKTNTGYSYSKPTSRIAATARPLEPDFRSKRNGRGKTVEGTGRGSKMSSDKEVRQILAKAEAMGAQTKKQGNDHIAVTYKGETKVISATPGDKNKSNREKMKDLGINV